MRNADFILASASPRRRDLLRKAGCSFEIVIPRVDEEEVGVNPGEVAVRNALAKARAVAAQRPDMLVLGADTVVHLDGRIIGKPADAPHARLILEALSGSTHEVLTGVALVCQRADYEITGKACTKIKMRTISREEIDEYVASGEGLDKAGAYAVQENGDKYIEQLDGSFTNVVGLPLELVGELLKKARLKLSGVSQE